QSWYESTQMRVLYEFDFDLTVFQRSKSPRVVHFRHTEAAVTWRGFIRSRGEHRQNLFGTLVLMNLRPDHEFSRLERKRYVESNTHIPKLIVHPLDGMHFTKPMVIASAGLQQEFHEAAQCRANLRNALHLCQVRTGRFQG